MILLCFATVAGCKASPPQDCSLAGRQVLQCMEDHIGSDDRALLLACLPFSKPQRISGTWVYGFELNQFFSGQRASSQFLRSVESDTSLEVEDDIPNDERRRVFQVDVIGRRSRCDMGVPKHVIVVDRVVSYSLAAISD